MRFGVPPVGPDLRIWAGDLRRWIERSFDALTYRNASATASQDGILLWDVAGYPVVSRDGVWVGLQQFVSAPATATSPGTAGDFAADADYLYICTATNTWKRVAVATW